ncbi:MAG: sugar phosphate isomerase/epimerase [Chloroflexi bacterium]|nr:sugar phosphate isomerase/epimerase [Chloroflexota bacterium]
MDIGVVMILLADRGWDEALDIVAGEGVGYVEPCSGGWFPKVHYDAAELLRDRAALDRFVASLNARGIRIAALSCCANPLHPDRSRQLQAHSDFVDTCHLAAELEVPRVSVIAGCPAGGPADHTVNWIVRSVFDDPSKDVEDMYRWQWEEKALPYWSDAAGIAQAAGTTICMEPMAGQIVYNAETFERLRNETGGHIAALVDPSHLFWQGIDIMMTIERLSGTIGYAHAKDSSLDTRAIARDGLVSSREYDDWEHRSWIPRAVGYGHSELFWREFLITLRRSGYDGPVSIEIEEPFLAATDALSKSVQFLRAAMPNEPPPQEDWFEVYQPMSNRLA